LLLAACRTTLVLASAHHHLTPGQSSAVISALLTIQTKKNKVSIICLNCLNGDSNGDDDGNGNGNG
jgi:hypothetical protein